MEPYKHNYHMEDWGLPPRPITKPNDGWGFHDAPFRRHISDVGTFVFYATSPSTVYAEPEWDHLNHLSELRAYGPGDGVVSCLASDAQNYDERKLLSIALGTLKERGILR